MRIGYLYKDTSKYSEGFIWHEVQLLQELGFDVTVFVKQHDKDTKLPVQTRIIKAFSIPRVFSLSTLRCGFSLFFRSFIPAFRLYTLERKDGAGIMLSLKRVYYAAHILPYKLDYLVYTFYPLVRQRARIAQAIRAKMVICLRGYDPLIEGELLNMADQLFVRSQDLYQTALSHGLRSDVFYKVVPSAVNLEQIVFKPLQERRPGALSILAVGRAHWKKGYEYLLTGLKLLKEEQVLFYCNIVAAGEELDKMKTMIEQLGLSSQVFLLGELPQREVIKQLHQSELFIHSSISEGCSNVVLEAQAAGTFCLASNIKGNNIKDGFTGLSFDAHNPESMVGRVKDYLKLEENNRVAILKNARAYMEADFSFQVLSNNLKAFYSR